MLPPDARAAARTSTGLRACLGCGRWGAVAVDCAAKRERPRTLYQPPGEAPRAEIHSQHLPKAPCIKVSLSSQSPGKDSWIVSRLMHHCRTLDRLRLAQQEQERNHAPRTSIARNRNVSLYDSIAACRCTMPHSDSIGLLGRHGRTRSLAHEVSLHALQHLLGSRLCG